MKLTHEMCNEQFEKADIITKRYIILILSKIQYDEEKQPKWPKDIISQLSKVSDEALKLNKAVIGYKYKKGRYYTIHNDSINLSAVTLRMLKELPVKRMPDETTDNEPVYQINNKKDHIPKKKNHTPYFYRLGSVQDILSSLKFIDLNKYSVEDLEAEIKAEKERQNRKSVISAIHSLIKRKQKSK